MPQPVSYAGPDGFDSRTRYQNSIRRYMMFGLVRSKTVRELAGRVNELEGQLIDALSGVSIGSTNTSGNGYTTLSSMVTETKRKYKNEADWGCPFVQRIINLRKALVMPHGIRLMPAPGVKPDDSNYTAAKEVLMRFIEFNDFNEGLAIELVKEGELEGNVLVDLRQWDNVEKTVKVIYRPWSTYQYTIKVAPTDPSQITSVTWNPTTSLETPVTINSANFAFVYFNGMLNEFKGIPTVGPVLTVCENLHKTLTHWNRFNSLFAKAMPVFECQTEAQVRHIEALINSHGWRLGDAVALVGKFSFATPDSTGVASSLEGEIKADLQIIAGHTGVGPHFLGFPDLMSNRSTADSMGEPTEVVSTAEISLWKNFYEDMFDKVIDKHNAQMNKKVQTGLVKPQLLPMTDRQWERARMFWLPAARDRLVSQALFLENIPDVDAEKELERQEEEANDRWMGAQFDSQDKAELAQDENVQNNNMPPGAGSNGARP